MAIDDFGTGFSSLAYLRTLPVNYIKLDRCFVAELDDGHTAVADTVIALARNLGMDVVAEGVETDRQMQVLEASAARCCKASVSASRYPSRTSSTGAARACLRRRGGVMTTFGLDIKRSSTTWTGWRRSGRWRRGSSSRATTTIPGPRSSPRILGADVPLASKVMKLANSAYFGMSGKVTSLQYAIAVVGFGTVRSMASVALSGHRLRGLLPEGFWDTSVHLAAVSAIAGTALRRTRR